MTQTKVEAPFVENNATFRNLLINGDMSIAQRATSTTGYTGGQSFPCCDRWKIQASSAGTWTCSQSTTVPAGQGFFNSYKIDCTTANSSLDASDYLFLRQEIEGQNLQMLRKGTANAKKTTLSFWVRSNLTGTYIVEFDDNDNTRNINKSYTIDSADTWEKKSITFEGDTSGAFDNDNGISGRLFFWLAGGSNWTTGTLATSWEATNNVDRGVGQANLSSSTDNEWYVTGVQFEVGDAATDFEHLPYDINLQRCQRYYYVHTSGAESNTSHVGLFNAYSSSNIQISIFHPVQMRAAASADFVQGTNFYIAYGNGGSDSFDGFDLGSEGNKNGSALYTSSKNVSVTQASPYFVRVNGSTGATARVAFDAEM